MIMLNISMAKGESLNRTVVLFKLDRGGSPVGHKINNKMWFEPFNTLQLHPCFRYVFQNFQIEERDQSSHDDIQWKENKKHSDWSSSQSEGENSVLCYSVPLSHLTRFMNNCVQIVIMIMLNISMAKGESLNGTVVLLKLDRGGSPVDHKMNKQNVMWTTWFFAVTDILHPGFNISEFSDWG